MQERDTGGQVLDGLVHQRPAAREICVCLRVDFIPEHLERKSKTIASILFLFMQMPVKVLFSASVRFVVSCAIAVCVLDWAHCCCLVDLGTWSSNIWPRTSEPPFALSLIAVCNLYDFQQCCINNYYTQNIRLH